MEQEERHRMKNSETGDRIPPGQKVTGKFPVLHAGQVPQIDVSKWTFTIKGLVEREAVFDYEQFTSLENVEVVSDIHCVTGWSKLDNHWEGVSPSTVGDLVTILPEARFVIVHSVGDFTTNLSLDDFFQPDVLFATKHNRQPLTIEHGYPVRLVVPRLYFWKSAKWVEGVEFTAEDRPGFWETRGYHNRGDPWLEERYSD
jgi:DMSO/TMAO reductase YedYZ molybdopterin-dependent catalytic subunit